MSVFHCAESCNKCKGENIIKARSTCDGYVCECETECSECGHVDFWAYGYFESRSEMESNCKTYTVITGNEK